MKPLTGDSLLARVLAKLAAVVIRHPHWFIWPQAGLLVIGVLITVFFLQFDTNQNDLVGHNFRDQQNFLALQKEFPQQGNDLVVVAESDDTEKNRQFIERLAAKMATIQTRDDAGAKPISSGTYFTSRIPRRPAPKRCFLHPKTTSPTSKARLHEDLPFIRQFTQTTNLITFFEQINTDFRTASAGTNTQTESMLQALPVLGNILTQATAALQMPGKPPSPGVASLFGSSDVSDIYITANHGRIFLLTTHPPSDDLVGDATEELRRLMAQTQYEVQGVNVGLTGEPVLDYDEMVQSQKT